MIRRQVREKEREEKAAAEAERVMTHDEILEEALEAAYRRHRDGVYTKLEETEKALMRAVNVMEAKVKEEE